MKKSLRALAILIALSLVSTVNAQPVHTILQDGGGETAVYEAKYAQWARDKARVIIDGECASACTLVMSTRYKLDVCATDKAELLFHKPFYTDINDRKKLLDTPYYRAKAEVDWYERFVDVMPASIANVLMVAPIPSVYKGAKASDMQGWRAPHIFRHVKKCE